MLAIEIEKKQLDALFELMKTVTKPGRISRSAFFKVVHRKYNDVAAPTREKAEKDRKALFKKMEEKARKKLPKGYLNYVQMCRKYGKNVGKGRLRTWKDHHENERKWAFEFGYSVGDYPVKVSKKDAIEYERLLEASQKRNIRDFTPQFVAKELKSSEEGLKLLALVDDVIDLINAQGKKEKNA